MVKFVWVMGFVGDLIDILSSNHGSFETLSQPERFAIKTAMLPLVGLRAVFKDCRGDIIFSPL